MQLSSSFGSEECQPGKGEGEGDEEGEGDPSDGDSDSFFARNSEEIVRPRVVIPTTMPAVHSVFPHNTHDHDYQHCQQDEDGGDVDDGWAGYGARPSHRMGSRRGKDVYGEDEEEEDEEEDDDDGSGGEQPIEVRRRHLAWADHDLDDDDDEDEDEDEDAPPPTPP